MKILHKRLGPFLALLDARYLPLLFAVAPQARAVYLWLFVDSDRSDAAWYFAVLGALGFEMIYVGAIAWSEDGRLNGWSFVTALAALLFSTATAVFVYIDQGYWAALHAGFPVVAFCYTMQMHSAASHDDAHPDREAAQIHAELAQAHAELAQLAQGAAQEGEEVAQAYAEAEQLRAELAQREQEAAQISAERAHADRLAAQERARAAQLEQELAHIQAAGPLDPVAIARVLREREVSLRDVAALVRMPESTLRSKLAKTNGHIVKETR